MGFGTIFVQIIFFILFFMALVGFFSISKAIAIDNKTSIMLREQTAMNKIKSEITIYNLSYYSGEGIISIYVNNTGKLKLKQEELDIYVDGSRIPRDQTNRTIKILPQDFLNPTLWDPDESIEINVTYSLSTGTHYVDVITEYSTDDTQIISTG
jgi:archaellum component FlaG (FlaF/FlaG flagellin family)